MTAVLLIGDVGLTDGRFHVGDEAMFAAAISELSQRGVTEITATSVTPAHTNERYGIPAIARLDFSDSRTPRQFDREDRLDRVVRAARGETGLLDWSDPAWAVIEHVAAADVVLFCGGGNLNSSWPEHVYERSAIARLAKVFSVRLVISGQTLGPALTQRDGELVAEILDTAALVGVREGNSHDLAGALGDFAHIVRTVDDAAFLAPPASIGSDWPDTGTYCLATFAPYTGSAPSEDFIRRIARFLDDVVAITDLDVVLLPHHASTESGVVDEDRRIHELIVQSMNSDRVVEFEIKDSSESAELARRAALSVSTRYHSAVFALAGGVPSITFATDEYTDVKLVGASENFGLVDGALSMLALATDDARDMLLRIWKEREAIREHLDRAGDARRDGARQWWDAVAAQMVGDSLRPDEWWAAPECRVLSTRLRERNVRLRAWVRDEGRARIGAEIARRGASEDITSLKAQILLSESELGEAHADVEVASQRAAEAEAALQATQDLLAQMAEPLFERTLRAHPTVVRAEEMEALLNSRTFRWTSKPRAVYGKIRRRLGR